MCHKECAGISDEVFKFISAQVKASGVTYWGCRCCTSFAKSFHSKLGEMNRRLEDLEKKSTENSDGMQKNKEDIKKVREEVREMRKEKEEAEKADSEVWEEMRDREARRRNLIFHRIKESSAASYEGRQQEDRNNCGEVLHTIGLKLNVDEIIVHSRRVGEKGKDPRPLVVTISSEEDRRRILNNAKKLAGTSLEDIGIVPDLTWKQRRAEENLWKVAEERNRNLSEEDKAKNLQWTVAGPRGEKRLTKGLGTRGTRGQHGGGTRGRPYQRGGRGWGSAATGSNAVPIQAKTTKAPFEGRPRGRPAKKGKLTPETTRALEPEPTITRELEEDSQEEEEDMEGTSEAEEESEEEDNVERTTRKRAPSKRTREVEDSGEENAPPEKR